MKLAIVATAALLSVCSCAFITESPRFVPRPEPGNSYTDRAPAKVHLLDGSVVVCRTGIRVRHDTLYPAPQSAEAPPNPSRRRGVRAISQSGDRPGSAVRYDLARQDSVKVEAVPMESVVGIEHYDRHTNVGSGLAWSPMWISAIAGAGAFVLAGMILAGAPW
jgi:hypothetical protein